MDTLPSSRIHMIAMGIDCTNSSHFWIRIWNYTVRCVSVLIMVSLLSLQLYGIVFYDKVLIVNAVHVTIFSATLLSYVLTFAKTRRLFKILEFAFQRMDKNTLSKIREFDNRHVTIKFCYFAIVVMGLITYFKTIGADLEASVLSMGFKKEFPSYCTKLVFVCVIWTGWITMFLVQFYISILFVTVQIAEQVKFKFLQWTMTGEPDYNMMRRSLEWYNKLLKIVNEEAGMIPFGILAMEFMMFACGISFVVTGSELGVLPMLALLTTGMLNVSFIRTFYQLIHLAHKSRRNIRRAWKIAEESVADPFSMQHDGSSHAMKTRKSLKFFLITESVVPAKAVDNIVIDHSLILNFFNQLIPFTVMMFTTLKEFERKPKCWK